MVLNDVKQPSIPYIQQICITESIKPNMVLFFTFFMKLWGHKIRKMGWQFEGKMSWSDLCVLSLNYKFFLTLYDSEMFHHLSKWYILRNLISQHLISLDDSRLFSQHESMKRTGWGPKEVGAISVQLPTL